MHELHSLLQEFAVTDLQELLINATRSIDRVFPQKRVVESSPFRESFHLTRELQRFAHERRTRLDPLIPFAGGEMKVGKCLLRWHIVIPPASFDGPVASFRRHRFAEYTAKDFMASAALCRQLVSALQDVDRPVFFAGPTGSGKTTLLVSLLTVAAQDERVVIFEAVPEIPIANPLWVRFVSRPRTAEGTGEIKLLTLAQESLRMRPDRFVLAELRGEEARALYYLWTAGHKGVYATVHLGSADQLLLKLAQLCPDLKAEWRELFAELQPLVVMMGRSHPPQVQSLWSYAGERFRPLM